MTTSLLVFNTWPMTVPTIFRAVVESFQIEWRSRIGVALKMTQEKLAELVGVNPRTVQKIEAGRLNILVTTLARIQEALGCGWKELMS